MSVCIAADCDNPATDDADECAFHLKLWEEEGARRGLCRATCEEGHYACAHHEDGVCHAGVLADEEICDHPLCELAS